MQKKRLKKILRLLLGILSGSLISCAITPPDVPLCTEISPSRGFCVNTMSSTEFEISDQLLWQDQTWWEIRPKMILMPAMSWVEIKSFIISICKKSNKCSGQAITDWERTVETIDKKIAGDKE